MRLVDVLFRQGHLSERALVDAIMSGDRPFHLDRCDICAARAVELNRWLDTVQTVAAEAADEAFPQERLAAQQSQILRRLEQVDEPARVIAFPGQSRPEAREIGRFRVAPGWVAVAAGLGLVIGAAGGQFTARLNQAPAPVAVAPTAPVTVPDPEPAALTNAYWVDPDDLDGYVPASLDALNEATPRVVASVRR
jgi:anti-sigma factor RsiW